MRRLHQGRAGLCAGQRMILRGPIALLTKRPVRFWGTHTGYIQCAANQWHYLDYAEVGSMNIYFVLKDVSYYVDRNAVRLFYKPEKQNEKQNATDSRGAQPELSGIS